ncbi:MAG: Hsp20/alpha crystallin family protein [Streptosporangiaceae bacterium]|jgi:HSP20 family protein
MSALTRRDGWNLFPDFIERLEQPFMVLRPFTAHAMRMEDCIENGRYLVRAELPGINPEKDAEVTVSDRTLTIHAERQETKQDKHRSEFQYGSFTRQVTLPGSADDKDVQATYDKGILEVSVGLRSKDEEQERVGRRVPVRLVQHIKHT